MFQRKLMAEQILLSGVRIGDSCSIFPSHGQKKAFTLNRNCIDLISRSFRPQNLCMSYIELPNSHLEPFHYRLELDDTASKNSRFVLKTMKGHPFWLNGLAAKEAYVERLDRLFIDDNKVNFDPCDLGALTAKHFDHPLLRQTKLLESDLKILIQGETGTGKTHLASKIHELSGRAGSFVAINLSSYNPQLIESELFGHKKGSFTGAVADKTGAFAEAANGTLFLDEIDSLPLDLQTKLLTFIDNKKFRRVGEVSEKAITTRLVFASGRKLEGLVAKGSFRKDFYYRLMSGHSVDLQPLRAGPNKIREACQYYSLENNVSVSQKLIDFYQTLAWPGNLRQLFGHLDKKKVLSRSIKLDFDASDEELLQKSSDLMSLEVVDDIISMEESKITHAKRALLLCDGSVSEAAKKLRVTEKTVRSLLSKA